MFRKEHSRRGCGSPASALCEELGEVLFKSRSRLSADDRFDDLAALEDFHRGNIENVVLNREVGELINVELDDVDFVGVRFGDCVENG